MAEQCASAIVNPPKPSEDVLKEGLEGHDLYVVSHHDYFAGEAKNRKYNPESFQRFKLYGGPTPHFNDGRTMAKTLHWLHELQMERGAKITSKRFDDFKEKFQHKVGRVLDPMSIGESLWVVKGLKQTCSFQLQVVENLTKESVFSHSIAETMNIAPGHTFGACLKPEEYGDGMIDREELHESCDQANLHLDEVLLNQLFEYCDVDQDGLINFVEFANFLNWKDNVPLTEYEKRVIIKGRKQDCKNITETNMREVKPTLLIQPEDIVPKEPGSSEETVRVLLRPSDKVSNHYKTTSSEINGIVGAVPPMCYPIYGVPMIRSDIPAPRIRRVGDVNNYGEEGNAYSLLHPSIFSQKGVFETDFFKTRSKEEISDILTNIGVKLSEEEFENVWNLASKKHHRGEVCVETIRNVLDELQHASRDCKTVM
ncbi:EF-hand domain-containing family member B [Cricetulus griseus]|uniref:EF-hand domain-containing family member B n=1 Tax=Cricetulus griseus TaxID=10029 RepID=G3H8L8_CRIGR|nr:EF-hand domain-containing family member B [Cricetulus griseus]